MEEEKNRPENNSQQQSVVHTRKMSVVNTVFALMGEK